MSPAAMAIAVVSDVVRAPDSAESCAVGVEVLDLVEQLRRGHGAARKTKGIVFQAVLW